MILEAAEVFGRLDGLVLNHAYSVVGSTESITAENIDKPFNINVRASILMIQEFIKYVDVKKGL